MTAPRLPSYSFEDFKARAVVGQQMEGRVARLLRHWGYDVPDPEGEIVQSKTAEQLSAYTRTQKDLVVNGVYLEVKSRKMAFTSRDDYPYPTVFLETVSGWEAKERKPDIYVIVSQATGAILAVDARDPAVFTQSYSTDHARGFGEMRYEVSKEKLRPHTWLEGFLAATRN